MEKERKDRILSKELDDCMEQNYLNMENSKSPKVHQENSNKGETHLNEYMMYLSYFMNHPKGKK